MNKEVSGCHDNRVDLSSHYLKNTIPSWIVWTQCICFAVLYGIWNYPLTNFLSDLCMIVGALLSVYILYINRDFFRTKQAIPFWLLVLLLVWIVFHFLFLSNSFTLQLRELTNIWKRVVIGIIFGLGFGIALANSKPKKGYWILFYMGMTMPALIFLSRYGLNIIATHYGSNLPEYFVLHSNRDSVFYMYKTDHSAFLLPTVAITLAQLSRNFLGGRIFTIANFIYCLVLMSVLTIFYLVDIKNGMAYSAILIFAFLFFTIRRSLAKLDRKNLQIESLKKSLVGLFAAFLLGFFLWTFLGHHIEKNPSWKSIWVDSQLAVQVDQIDAWKYWGGKGYPINEYGKSVARTNYERIAWGVIGLRLLQENPFGYGLAENSFGYLTKLKWPDSLLLQSHSGWLDLALGIGIPGVGLILTTLGLVLFGATKKKRLCIGFGSQDIWCSRLLWVLWSLLLLWITSEISFKIYIIALLFWVAFGIGLMFSEQSNSFKTHK